MPILHGRLACLMFLQYFMMGSWFVSFGSFMSKGLGYDQVIGLAYGSQGIATILSAFAIGALADRFLATEKLLGLLFLLSAVTLISIGFAPAGANWFLFLVFLHFLVFIPTIPLANALCFRWLADPAAQFPRIRAVGTIGWIASGFVVGAIPGAAETRLPLLIAAGIGVLLAIYSLTLPHTPPHRTAAGDRHGGLLGLDVIAKQANRAFWVLIGATLLIMIPMAFYYAYCNNFLLEAGAAITIGAVRLEATAIQSLGQVSELAFLLLLPLLLAKFGIKGVFLLGIGSWVLRYLMFAAAWNQGDAILWMLVAGVLLHGAANDFVQVAGQVYVNETFSAEARSRAQALFTTVLMGVGAILGSLVANIVYAASTISQTRHDWQTIWLLPAAASFGTLLCFALLFRPASMPKNKAKIC